MICLFCVIGILISQFDAFLVNINIYEINVIYLIPDFMRSSLSSLTLSVSGVKQEFAEH